MRFWQKRQRRKRDAIYHSRSVYGRRVSTVAKVTEDRACIAIPLCTVLPAHEVAMSCPAQHFHMSCSPSTSSTHIQSMINQDPLDDSWYLYPYTFSLVVSLMFELEDSILTICAQIMGVKSAILFRRYQIPTDYLFPLYGSQNARSVSDQMCTIELQAPQRTDSFCVTQENRLRTAPQKIEMLKQYCKCSEKQTKRSTANGRRGVYDRQLL